MNKYYNDHCGLADGSEWPPGANAYSMVGMRRLDHFAAIVAHVIETGVPGHVIETGCWRGGASFMAAKTIELLNQNDHRFTYLCDSFKGIPTTSKNCRFFRFVQLCTKHLFLFVLIPFFSVGVGGY